jgi:hypothetical protein
MLAKPLSDAVVKENLLFAVLAGSFEGQQAESEKATDQNCCFSCPSGIAARSPNDANKTNLKYASEIWSNTVRQIWKNHHRIDRSLEDKYRPVLEKAAGSSFTGKESIRSSSMWIPVDGPS